jgi:hypothetical protein
MKKNSAKIIFFTVAVFFLAVTLIDNSIATKYKNVPCVLYGIGYSKYIIEKNIKLEKSDSDPNYYYIENPCTNIFKIVYKFKRGLIFRRVKSVTINFSQEISFVALNQILSDYGICINSQDYTREIKVKNNSGNAIFYTFTKNRNSPYRYLYLNNDSKE